MRKHADILIYVDLAKALDDGYKFFISQNGVVLSAGNAEGFLPPQYFLRVETSWKNYPLPGYENANEKSGSEQLYQFDVWDRKNSESQVRTPRRKYKWDDPIVDLLDEVPTRPANS